MVISPLALYGDHASRFAHEIVSDQLVGCFGDLNRSGDAAGLHSACTAFLTGGTEEPRTGSLVGPMAVRTAQSFLYDSFFSSAAALDLESGPSEAALAESEVKRAFSQTSSRIVVAVDHSKLDTKAQARVLDFDQIDLLVTDLDPSDHRLDGYRDLVEII